MNGNELADVLRWPEEKKYQYSWYAGQRLPEEWWKTEFPYGRAEEMGYRLSPEETRRFYERKKEKEKTLSEELADILKRPEVKMLDPLQRAELIDRVQKAQAAIAEREEAREKHEAEMMAMGREVQLREGVQEILRSDRVPAQKVTALTVAGVPLSEARKMVWGEREPEERVERPGVAPRARATPEELVEALRPERARGVQFRMVGGELIKERAGKWEEKYTPEEREAERRRSEERYEKRRAERIEATEAERERIRKAQEETRTRARAAQKEELEREERKAKERQERIDYIDALGEEYRTKRQKAEQEHLEKMQEQHRETRKAIKEAIEKDEERKEKEEEARRERIKEIDEIGRELADKRYKRKMEKIKYDDEKAEIAKEEVEEKKKFKLDMLEKTFNWIELFDDKGFESEDFVNIISRFLGAADINERLKQGLLSGVEEYANAAKRVDEADVRELEDSINAQAKLIEREKITPEIENQIELLAFAQLRLDAEKLGENKAIERWESTLATGGWYFGAGKTPFTKTSYQRIFRERMKTVVAEARKAGLIRSLGSIVGKQAEKTAGDILKKKPKDIQSKLPLGLESILTQFDESERGEIIDIYGDLFTKTGQRSEPSRTDREAAIEFIIGEFFVSEEEKKDIPVNMDPVDCIRAIKAAPELSNKQKAWLFEKQGTPALWEGIKNEANVRGNLLMEKELSIPEPEPSLWEKVTGWWPFGKEKKNIEDDVRDIFSIRGRVSRTELEAELRKRDYSDEEIARFLRR